MPVAEPLRSPGHPRPAVRPAIQAGRLDRSPPQFTWGGFASAENSGGRCAPEYVFCPPFHPPGGETGILKRDKPRPP